MIAQDHTHHNENRDAGSIGVAFLLNLGFTILEIVGGLWTNSMAILADAVHDLGDSFALGSAWHLERLSVARSNEHFSYGYGRFSLLGALISTTVLIVGSLFVLSEAIPRLIHPQHSNAPGMVGLAVVGLLVNGVAALRLRGKQGLNARIVAWHLLEDVLGWLAILVVSIVLLFKDVHVLDPALSVLITVYVLINVLKGLRSTMNILLQGAPEGVDLLAIKRKVEAVKGVLATHHAHIWSLDGSRHVFTAHVVVAPEVTRSERSKIKQRIRSILSGYGIQHTTIELESPGEFCSMSDEDQQGTNNSPLSPG